jgi:hypothetical protein
MQDAHGTPLRVQVAGIVRGRELDHEAIVELAAGALVIAWNVAAPWRLSLDRLEGIQHVDGLLTLYLQGGDVIELRGDVHVAAFAAQLADTIHVMPELTRGLRSLGSVRGTPGPAHDRWFAPMLAPRRAVVDVHDPVRQLALFDVQKLLRELDRAIAEIAAVNAPEGGARRRALEAALEEEAEPLFVVLERLGERAQALQESPIDQRLAEWRRWVRALHQVFSAADECWPRCAALLPRAVSTAAVGGPHAR